MVNSVLSTYNTRFEEQKIPWEAQVTIGEKLPLSEKSGHLLLMAKNTVRNAPVFNDGVPVTERSGHGLGARSIVYYVEKLNGQYQFFMENGDFVVRIIL